MRSDKVRDWAICLVFSAPFFFGLWAQLRKSHAAFFLDLNAIACAGDALRRGAALYQNSGDCPFGESMPYVYPPPLAALMSALQSRYGASFELVLFGAVYGFCIGKVVFDLVSCERSELIYRAPFFCALTARAMFSGNISIVFHAALYMAIVYARRDVLTVMLIVLFSICKPTFLVYAAIFAFLDRSWAYRLGLAAITLAATGSYFLWFHASDPDRFAQWISVSQNMGLALAGHSLLGFPGVREIGNVPAMAALYAIFACALLGAGARIGASLGADARSRLFVGLAVCVLLNPRLMAYDHLTLPFGMAVIARNCAALTGRWRPGFYAGLALVVALVVGFGGKGDEILFAACVALTLSLAMGLTSGAIRHAPPSSAAA
jgi:hypothetical protein